MAKRQMYHYLKGNIFKIILNAFLFATKQYDLLIKGQKTFSRLIQLNCDHVDDLEDLENCISNMTQKDLQGNKIINVKAAAVHFFVFKIDSFFGLGND